MATIPQTPSLAPRSSRQQGIVSGPGNAGFDPLAGVSDDLNELKKIRDQNEVASASLEFRRARAELDQTFEGRVDDHEKFVDEYHEKSTETLGVLAQKITDPVLRDQWLMERDADVIHGQQRIAEKARGIYVDKERAGLLEGMEDLLKRSGEAGDVAGNWQSVKQSLDAKVAAKVISAQEAQVWGEKWRADASLRYVKGLPDPQDQIDAMSAEWAKNIPVHVRRDITDKAQQKIREQKTFDFIKGLDGVERVDALQKITEKYSDVKDYEAALIKYNQRTKDLKSAKLEKQNDLYESLADSIIAGDFRYDQLSDEEVLALDVKQQANLKNLEKVAAEIEMGSRIPTYSDPEVKATMDNFVYGGRGTLEDTVEYFRNNFSELNSADRAFYRQATESAFKGTKEPVFDSIVTAKQTFENLRKGLNDEQAWDAWQSINQELRDYYNKNQVNLTKPAVIEVVTKHLLEIDRTPGTNWNPVNWRGTTRYYQMSDEEKQDFDAAASALLRLMPTASNADIVKFYETRLARRADK
jgi:hypothetical protein